MSIRKTIVRRASLGTILIEMSVALASIGTSNEVRTTAKRLEDGRTELALQ